MNNSIPKLKDFLTQKEFWAKNWQKFKEHKEYKGFKATLATLLLAGGGTTYYYWAHIWAAIDWVMSHNYPVMMVTIITVGLAIHFITPKQDRGNEFWTVFLFSGTLGNLWGLYAVTVDPNMPGWIYVPGTNTGPEFYMILEDWTFYLGFVFFFYKFYHFFLYKYGNKDFSIKTSNIIKEIHFFGFLLLVVFFLFFTTYCGRSLALLGVPAILLFIPLWKYVNARLLTLFVVFATTVEVVLDWLQVTILSDFVPNWIGWVYIGFDGNGNHMQSKFFLDYVEYPWSWFWGFQRNPVEITPWFGIVGAYLIYFTILGIKCLRNYSAEKPLTEFKPQYNELPLKSILSGTLFCIIILTATALVRVYTLSKGAY